MLNLQRGQETLGQYVLQGLTDGAAWTGYKAHTAFAWAQLWVCCRQNLCQIWAQLQNWCYCSNHCKLVQTDNRDLLVRAHSASAMCAHATNCLVARMHCHNETQGESQLP